MKYIILILSLFFALDSFTQNGSASFTLPDTDCVEIAKGRMFVMPITANDGYFDPLYTNRPGIVTNWGGNLGGISGADAKCQAYAQSWNLPGTYEALLADASLTGANDRLTKHWNEDLKNPTTGLNFPGTTSDGDPLKISDAFSGISPRTNIGGTALEYADVVLMPDGTKMTDADNNQSPELVHGYLVHSVTGGNIPMADPTNTCGNWTNTTGTAWSAWGVGQIPDAEIGAASAPGGSFPNGMNLSLLTCGTGFDHAIFCIGI